MSETIDLTIKIDAKTGRAVPGQGEPVDPDRTYPPGTVYVFRGTVRWLDVHVGLIDSVRILYVPPETIRFSFDGRPHGVCCVEGPRVKAVKDEHLYYHRNGDLGLGYAVIEIPQEDRGTIRFPIGTATLLKPSECPEHREVD